MKRVFLLVGGSDYSALDFEQNFNSQKFYEDMVAEGKTLAILDDGEFYIEVEIKEFGEIDDNFIDFVKDFIDYDFLKHTDFIEVKAKEETA